MDLASQLQLHLFQMLSNIQQLITLHQALYYTIHIKRIVRLAIPRKPSLTKAVSSSFGQLFCNLYVIIVSFVAFCPTITICIQTFNHLCAIIVSVKLQTLNLNLLLPCCSYIVIFARIATSLIIF